MATITKKYAFAPGTKIQSAEVNANFDDLFAFLNTKVAHLDGSKAFEGIPLLPNQDPTGGNQAARKAYVDGRVAAAQSYARGLVRFGGHAGMTNAVGDIVIPHGLGVVPAGVQLTPATMRDGSGNPVAQHGWYPTIEAMDATNLNVRVFSTQTGLLIPNTSFNIHWAVAAP